MSYTGFPVIFFPILKRDRMEEVQHITDMTGEFSEVIAVIGRWLTDIGQLREFTEAAYHTHAETATKIYYAGLGKLNFVT